MVDLLNSTQRDRDLLPHDNVFSSICGQIVDECVNDVDIEYMSLDHFQL